MANLGNTIVNGILRVNNKVNVGESVTAPSFIGTLNGEAKKAKLLNMYVNRPTDANITPADSSEYGAIRHDIASSTMTSNKPRN